MSEGLDTATGETEVEPGGQTLAAIAPETDVPGQVTKVSGDVDGQPNAQEVTEDSLPGGMPLPPNWKELPDHQRQALRESSAYWQTAMNGLAEKKNEEIKKYEQDANYFRQLSTDPSLLKQFAETRIPSVQQNVSAVPATASLDVELPDNLYEMDKTQLLSVIERQVTKAKEDASREINEIKQTLKNQALIGEVNALKAKFPDCEKYATEITGLYRQGYPLEHAYIVAKATVGPKGQTTLPPAPRSAIPPPDQTSVTASSTTTIKESNEDEFRGLSSAQMLKKMSAHNPEVARSLAILDGKTS